MKLLLVVALLVSLTLVHGQNRCYSIYGDNCDPAQSSECCSSDCVPLFVSYCSTCPTGPICRCDQGLCVDSWYDYPGKGKTFGGDNQGYGVRAAYQDADSPIPGSAPADTPGTEDLEVGPPAMGMGTGMQPDGGAKKTVKKNLNVADMFMDLMWDIFFTVWTMMFIIVLCIHFGALYFANKDAKECTNYVETNADRFGGYLITGGASHTTRVFVDEGGQENIEMQAM